MKTSARTLAHACHSRRGRSDCAHSSLGAPDGQAGKGANLVAIEDGPDAVNWTHADQGMPSWRTSLGKVLSKERHLRPKCDGVPEQGGRGYNHTKTAYGRVPWEQLFQNMQQTRYNEPITIASDRSAIP